MLCSQNNPQTAQSQYEVQSNMQELKEQGCHMRKVTALCM